MKVTTKIKQVWVPYWEWEDWLNGMWTKTETDSQFLPLAISFTGNWIEYGRAMREVAYEWPRTMLNSLTNPSINRRAFLGHCAVCYRHKIPEHITRQAWWELTDEQRTKADEQAQIVINSWLIRYTSDKQLKIPFVEYEERSF